MIRIEELSIRAGSFQLGAISLELSVGEYGALMGKTGSGKTTLLECLCGLRPIEKGRIELAGKDVSKLRPGERGIGYVPQDGAMFPKMTVRGHLEFPLVVRKWPKAQIEQRTAELAEMLAIRSLLDRFPTRLSGGEIQRVALGRALAFQPQLLLLDEPLSALDDGTRHKMYDVLRSVQEKTRVTTLHVTHSRDEANYLADSLFHLEDGQIVTEKSCLEVPQRITPTHSADP
jgi:ABC-type sugar transport system ATPase subunit